MTCVTLLLQPIMSTTSSNIQAGSHNQKQNSKDLLVHCNCKNATTTSYTRSSSRQADMNVLCIRCQIRTQKQVTSPNRTVRKMPRITGQVECARCTKSTKPVYRELEEWLCRACAPARDVCMASRNGCKYRDIVSKLHRHRQFYCTYNSECPMCKKSSTFGTLHYHTAHSDDIQVETYVWTALFDTDGHWYIVSAEHYDFTEQYELTVCRAQRDAEGFNLYVYIPVPSEQLYQYRCETELRHPMTGETITRSLNAVYQYDYDFHQHIPITESQLYFHNNKCQVKLEIIERT